MTPLLELPAGTGDIALGGALVLVALGLLVYLEHRHSRARARARHRGPSWWEW
jgi:hypothetical protein